VVDKSQGKFYYTGKINTAGKKFAVHIICFFDLKIILIDFARNFSMNFFLVLEILTSSGLVR